jgi:glutamine synthetase
MSFGFLGFADVHGALRGKAYDDDAFDALCARGYVATPDVLLASDPLDQPITTLTSIGVRAGAGDLRLEPVLSTMRPVPWDPGARLCLGDLYWLDGTPCQLSSRQVLRSVLDRLQGHDLRAVAAFEYEVRLTNSETGKPATPAQSYSARGLEQIRDFCAALQKAAAGLDLSLSVIHTEGGPGLVELNVEAAEALDAADNALILRHAVHEVARRHGLHASFLAKPVVEEEGSSGHVHVSLWSGIRNIMSAPQGPSPNDAMLQAINGLLRHLPAMSLLMNPNINSYKRLVPGFFAPVNVSWGVDNRSAAIRAITMDDANARLEVRRPGADANPYLVLAGIVAAMLEGLQAQVDPPAASQGDVQSGDPGLLAPLPRSLESAIEAFQQDQRLQDLLGREFSDYFVITRAWELRQWQRTVTDWELERYRLIT